MEADHCLVVGGPVPIAWLIKGLFICFFKHFGPLLHQLGPLALKWVVAQTVGMSNGLVDPTRMGYKPTTMLEPKTFGFSFHLSTQHWFFRYKTLSFWRFNFLPIEGFLISFFRWCSCEKWFIVGMKAVVNRIGNFMQLKPHARTWRTLKRSRGGKTGKGGGGVVVVVFGLVMFFIF